MMRPLPLLVLALACGGGDPDGEPVTYANEGSETETNAPSGEASAEPAASLAPEMAAVLDAHNQARAEHCAPPLEWSAELEAAASAWADELVARGCTLEHSQGSLGENLYAATAGATTPADAVEAWVRERDAYDFDRGGFSMQTGHFTQVAWKGTSRLGCATLECNGLDLWVCNYDPAGNVQGGYQANVSPQGCD